MRAAGSPDAALPDLLQMLEDPRVDRRVLALQTLLRFQLKAGHPAIARKAKMAPLHQLSGEERYALLTGLVALAPQQGEPVAVEIAKKGGLVTSDDREIVRIVACQVLGENSTSASGLMQPTSSEIWRDRPMTTEVEHPLAGPNTGKIGQRAVEVVQRGMVQACMFVVITEVYGQAAPAAPDHPVIKAGLGIICLYIRVHLEAEKG